MKTHDLVQGSPEWLAYRAQHFNASDAPAMMGVSKYKTRSQLLHELHTGVVADVDATTQGLFDAGHRFEALARPKGEEIIGEDLYPVVGSAGELSASFDGLTMDEATAFEHKSLNAELRACMGDGFTASDLPAMYRIQMEQQCMVSGCSRVLFMASKWDGDELIEERHVWYDTDVHLAQEIRAGWAQFAIDLANYRVSEVADKVVAEPILALPALSIQLRGEVVASNLKAYQDAATLYIQAIKTDLQTDEDFANAAATVTFCKDAEERLGLTKAAAIGQTATIDELMRTIDNIQEQFRAKRLTLDKLVDKRKLEIKTDIVMAARKGYDRHVAGLNAEIAPLYLVLDAPDFTTAAKAKRTVASLQDAVDTELARGKITADAVAKGVRAKVAWLDGEASEFRFLFADLQTLVQKPADDFQVQVRARITEHKARKAAAAAPAPAPAPARQPAPTARQAPVTMPTLTIGAINERLGFVVNADLLRTLGFESTKQGASKYYHEEDFAPICHALVTHIQEACDAVAA